MHSTSSCARDSLAPSESDNVYCNCNACGVRSGGSCSSDRGQSLTSANMVHFIIVSTHPCFLVFTRPEEAHARFGLIQHEYDDAEHNDTAYYAAHQSRDERVVSLPLSARRGTGSAHADQHRQASAGALLCRGQRAGLIGACRDPYTGVRAVQLRGGDHLHRRVADDDPGQHDLQNAGDCRAACPEEVSDLLTAIATSCLTRSRTAAWRNRLRARW